MHVVPMVPNLQCLTITEEAYGEGWTPPDEPTILPESCRTLILDITNTFIKEPEELLQSEIDYIIGRAVNTLTIRWPGYKPSRHYTIHLCIDIAMDMVKNFVKRSSSCLKTFTMEDYYGELIDSGEFISCLGMKTPVWAPLKRHLLIESCNEADEDNDEGSVVREIELDGFSVRESPVTM
jgi:hypothetical protein